MDNYSAISVANNTRWAFYSANDFTQTRLSQGPPSPRPKIPYPRRSSSLLFSASNGTMLPTLRETRTSSVVSSSSGPPMEVGLTAGPLSAPPSEGSESSASSANIGTILALVLAVLFLIVVTLEIYGCASLHKRTTHVDYLRSLYGSQRGPEHDAGDETADDDVELHDLEAHGPSYSAEVVVATARQGRVYGPGAASMVDIVKGRGSRRDGAGGSNAGKSSRFVVDVDSLPDLCEAQRLLSQGVGGRASTEIMSLSAALSDDTMATQGSGRVSKREHLSRKEALSGTFTTQGNMGHLFPRGGLDEEHMTRGARSGRSASAESLLLRTVATGGSASRAEAIMPRDRLSLREALEEEDSQLLPEAQGKRRRRFLRKREKSKSILSDMLRVYAA